MIGGWNECPTLVVAVVEQLDKLKLVPVYVRSTGTIGDGLRALQAKGAMPWPEPHSAEELDAVFEKREAGPAIKQASLLD